MWVRLSPSTLSKKKIKCQNSLSDSEWCIFLPVIDAVVTVIGKGQEDLLGCSILS